MERIRFRNLINQLSNDRLYYCLHIVSDIEAIARGISHEGRSNNRSRGQLTGIAAIFHMMYGLSRKR